MTIQASIPQFITNAQQNKSSSSSSSSSSSFIIIHHRPHHSIITPLGLTGRRGIAISGVRPSVRLACLSARQSVCPDLISLASIESG